MASSSASENSVALRFVAQHGQARLLVQNLAAEPIHHAHGPVAHRLDDRLIEPAALDTVR